MLHGAACVSVGWWGSAEEAEMSRDVSSQLRTSGRASGPVLFIPFTKWWRSSFGLLQPSPYREDKWRNLFIHGWGAFCKLSWAQLAVLNRLCSAFLGSPFPNTFSNCSPILRCLLGSHLMKASQKGEAPHPPGDQLQETLRPPLCMQSYVLK